MMSKYFKLYEKTLTGDVIKEKLVDGCRLVHIYSTGTFRAFYGSVSNTGDISYIGALSSKQNDLWLEVSKTEDGNTFISGIVTGGESHDYAAIEPIVLGSDKETLAFWPASGESFVIVQYGE